MGDRTHAANGIRDKREDAPQNSAITISWQGNDVAVSASDDSHALPGTEYNGPGTSIVQARLRCRGSGEYGVDLPGDFRIT